MQGKGRSPAARWLRRGFWVLVALALPCIAIAWRDTMADPVVRRAEVTIPGLPPGTPPIRALLLSDLHVAGPDMPPARLAHIVGQLAVLKPDIVLIAGDLISDRRLASRHYTYREALAPLAALRSPLGSFAVLGNHDHWRNAAEARAELERIGVKVLVNDAARTGPLVIGGLDDDYTMHADIRGTLKAVGPVHRGAVVISHSPDPFPALPSDLPLMLAGHTHCGQGRWPWGGAPAHMSRFGDRYACGRIDERGHTLIVSAGLGTSVVPFRFLVKPDVWLVTLKAPEGE